MMTPTHDAILLTRLTSPDLLPPNSDLIACPRCDALHRTGAGGAPSQLRCGRCGRRLIASRRGTGIAMILLALTALALTLGAAILPFLTIHRYWTARDATILDSALSLSGGGLAPFALLALALILGLPAARMVLSLYVLGPLVAGFAPFPGAARAFRWSEALRPWSMAEVFAIGAAVALVKISDFAQVEVGPAFWMVAALAVPVALHDTLICRWSLWTALER